jgi:hypothetical protein
VCKGHQNGPHDVSQSGIGLPKASHECNRLLSSIIIVLIRKPVRWALLTVAVIGVAAIGLTLYVRWDLSHMKVGFFTPKDVRTLVTAANAAKEVVVATRPELRDKQATTIEVHGPTIVAFFPPVTQAELDKDPDGNEALADFGLYAAQFRDGLGKTPITFTTLYTESFRVKVGEVTTVFRPDKVKVGYYLVAPNKRPRIEYGVRTDDDLTQIAREYFGFSI